MLSRIESYCRRYFLNYCKKKKENNFKDIVKVKLVIMIKVLNNYFFFSKIGGVFK